MQGQVHRLTLDFEAVGATVFGAIHRVVGNVEYLGRAVPVCRGDGDADTDADPHCEVPVHQRWFECLDDVPGDVFALFDCPSRIVTTQEDT